MGSDLVNGKDTRSQRGAKALSDAVLVPTKVTSLEEQSLQQTAGSFDTLISHVCAAPQTLQKG